MWRQSWLTPAQVACWLGRCDWRNLFPTLPFATKSSCNSVVAWNGPVRRFIPPTPRAVQLIMLTGKYAEEIVRLHQSAGFAGEN